MRVLVIEPGRKMEIFKQPEALRLDGANLEESWKLWFQKFDNFMKASGANTKPEDVQLAILLHVIGDDALSIYNTFVFSETEKGKIKPAIKKLEDYCSPRKNVVFERYQFGNHHNRRVRQLTHLLQCCDTRQSLVHLETKRKV